ncbi:sel1 repeat family protein [Gammaproteobacteria bacterium]|nr:sel1 repeat family protein [Gammaproteobacteria bacterium]
MKKIINLFKKNKISYSVLSNITLPGEKFYLKGLSYFNAKNYKDALGCFEDAAKVDNTPAIIMLCEMYYYGYGVKINKVKSEHYCDIITEENIDLLEIYSNNISDPEILNNINWLIGLCYFSGLGVIQDYVKSFAQYKLAADQGFAPCQNRIGYCYQHGYGVDKSIENAVKWYSLAAKQGYVSAQNQLGHCYNGCLGIEKDDKEAYKWFKLAADQKSAAAQNNIGCLLYNNKCSGQDYKEAVKLFLAAVEQGFASAQNNLAICYFHGHGVQKDYKIAIELFVLALEQDHSAAETNLKYLLNTDDGFNGLRSLIKSGFMNNLSAHILQFIDSDDKREIINLELKNNNLFKNHVFR